MLHLHVIRKHNLPEYTIGDLFVENDFFCNTLEDTNRHLSDEMEEKEIVKQKVYSKTAIPTGIYHIAMDVISSKFQSRIWARPYKGKIPRLLGIKGFEGVLIHPGNKAEDTLGCLLVGENKVKGQVINSQNTFYKLMNEVLLPAYKKDEEIIITIE